MASKGLCRFDRRCRRPDCYFDHPNGREIDEAPGGPYGGGAGGAGGGAFGGREGTDGNVYYPAEDGSYPAAAPLKAAGQGYGRGGGGGGGGGYRGRGGPYAGSSLLGRAPPMWGQWPEPYGGGLGPAQPMWPPGAAPPQFYPPAGAHGYYGAPGGGAYDDGHEGGPAWTPGGDDGNNEDDDEEDDVPFDSIDLEAETALKDTWMASARNCTCCKGYVYGCSGETCNALGVCVCTAGDMIEAENSERATAQATAAEEPEAAAAARASANGVDR